MLTPNITNKLRGALGEIYYKEYCDQKGWAYTSLENIYETMNSHWIFTFKKGFHRIKVIIPHEIRDEVSWLIKPTNNLVASPSFVFDFLACKVGTLKNYSKTITSTEFALVESKTGKANFSSSQYKTMSKITLPLAIFHIKDVLEAPKSIKMGFELKSGQEWLDDLEPVDNEIYEFTSKAKIANQF